VGEQPAVRRPEGHVAAVHRREIELVLVLAPGLDPELDQAAAVELARRRREATLLDQAIRARSWKTSIDCQFHEWLGCAD